MMVFLSDSSALALGTNIVPDSVKQNTVAAAVPNIFTVFLLFLRGPKSILRSIGAQPGKSPVYKASKREIGRVVAQGVDRAGSSGQMRSNARSIRGVQIVMADLGEPCQTNGSISGIAVVPRPRTNLPRMIPRDTRALARVRRP